MFVGELKLLHLLQGLAMPYSALPVNSSQRRRQLISILISPAHPRPQFHCVSELLFTFVSLFFCFCILLSIYCDHSCDSAAAWHDDNAAVP